MEPSETNILEYFIFQNPPANTNFAYGEKRVPISYHKAKMFTQSMNQKSRLSKSHLEGLWRTGSHRALLGGWSHGALVEHSCNLQVLHLVQTALRCSMSGCVRGWGKHSLCTVSE